MTHGLVVGVWARFSPSQALLMKTSVFHIELTYIIGNSESFEQWRPKIAPCAFLAILVNLSVDLLFFGANPPRGHCIAMLSP